MNKKNEYQLSDLVLASFLISAYQGILTKATKQGNRVVFHLESEKDLDKGVSDFYSGKDKVSAIQFISAGELLRDCIRRANNRE